MNSPNPKYSLPLKAVGLFSGGLDSALAARVVKDLGFQVHAVFFVMPWGCRDEARARQLAEEMGLVFKTIQLDEEYLEMLKFPRFGYGRAYNPCVDCHLYMIKKAGEYLRQTGGAFVFTGEVLGQRPMSQRRVCLDSIENDCGLEGRLLRPLSAQLLKPTRVEEEGLVDRAKLFAMSGRGRRPQLDLAQTLGVKDYAAPGGGCLLTKGPFGERVKDFLTHGYRDFKETAILRWGRYFRLNANCVALVGRDQEENEELLSHAYSGDLIFYPAVTAGPTVVLKGKNINDEILMTAAGLLQWFTKERGANPMAVLYHTAEQPQEVKSISPAILTEVEVDRFWVGKHNY